MKVKKKKEQWQAASYDGSGVPEDIKAEFENSQEERDWGRPYLTVSRYNQKKREWEDFDVQIGQWFVWSSYGKIKVLDRWDFEEKFEEDK